MKIKKFDVGKRKYNYVVVLTLDSIGGSSPASKSRTFHSHTSLNLFASTLPADPPPSIMKSNFE